MYTFCVIGVQSSRAQTLQPAWQAPSDPDLKAIHVEESSIILFHMDEKVFARDITSGAVLWQRGGDDSGFELEYVERVDSLRYMTVTEEHIELVDIRTGQELAKFSTEESNFDEDQNIRPRGAVTVVGVADSTWIVENSTGKILQRSSELHAIYPNPQDSSCLVETSRGLFFLDIEQPRVVSHYKLSYNWVPSDRLLSPVLFSPPYAIYFSDDDTLYGLNIEKGELLWKREYDATDADNVRLFTAGNDHYMVILDHYTESFYSLETGSEVQIETTMEKAFEGKLDLVHQLTGGGVAIVTFDIRDHMYMTVLDKNLTVLAVHQVGHGTLTFETGYPGTRSGLDHTKLCRAGTYLNPYDIETYKRKYVTSTGQNRYGAINVKTRFVPNFGEVGRAKGLAYKEALKEARRPQYFVLPTDYFYHRSTYAEFLPYGTKDGNDVFLLVGNIAPMSCDDGVDDCPSAEGLYSIDPRTGELKRLVEANLYQHEDTWSGFNVQFAGRWDKADSTTALITADFAFSVVTQDTVVRFQTNRFKPKNYTFEPLHVITYDNTRTRRFLRQIDVYEGGTIDEGFIARTDLKMMQIDKHPESPVGAYSYVDHELVLYPERQDEMENWSKDKATVSYTSHELDELGVGAVVEGETLNNDGVLGIRTFKDGIMYFGDEGVGLFSYTDPACKSTFTWKENGDHDADPKVVQKTDDGLLIWTTSSLIAVRGDIYCSPVIERFNFADADGGWVWDEKTQTLVMFDEDNEQVVAIR